MFLWTPSCSSFCARSPCSSGNNAYGWPFISGLLPLFKAYFDLGQGVYWDNIGLAGDLAVISANVPAATFISGSIPCGKASWVYTQKKREPKLPVYLLNYNDWLEEFYWPVYGQFWPTRTRIHTVKVLNIHLG